MRAAARRYAVPVAALALLLAACSDNDQEPSPDPTTSDPSSPSTPDSSTPPPSSTESSGLPSGGTPAEPAVVTAETKLLDWQQVPGSVESTVTRSSEWTLTLNKAGTRAKIEGPDSGSEVATSSRQRISDAFLDGQYAVVVLQDRQETQPSSAQVTDLATGNRFTVDGSSDIPTVNGGTWALGQGRLLHATLSKGAYCIASVDLATRKSTLGWCAPKRHGFNDAHVTPFGDSLMTFDDSRPACRTAVSLSGTEVEPFPGVPDCKAWDGLLLDDGAVWSVIPREKQIENAHFYARLGDGYFDLGPGTSGTLMWCADAAYFVRDPQRDGDPASLMRWSPGDGLSVVYDSPEGQAFLTAPRCGGDTITVTALAQAGDEQVSARVR